MIFTRSRRITSGLALAGCVAAAACGDPSMPGDGGADDAAAEAAVPAPARPAPGDPRLDPRQTHTCGAGLEATVDSSAIDPRLEGATVRVAVRVRDDGALAPAWAQPLRVAIVRGDAEVARLAERPDARAGTSVMAEWNGTAVQGAAGTPATPVPAGAYAVRVTLGCSPGAPPVTRDVPLTVLRVGAAQANVGDGEGERIPLLWHRLNRVARNYWLAPEARAVMVRGTGRGLAAVDDATAPGAPARAFPAVWTELETPPVTPAGDVLDEQYNLPVALRVGTRPDVTLTFARSADATVMGGGGTSPDAGAGGGNGARVRALVTGASAMGGADALVTDGGTATFRFDATPVTNVGRYDVPVRVRYEVQRGDGTWGLLGGEQFTLRLYGVLGQQTINRTTTLPQYQLWVAVADAVAGWVGGRTADPSEVAGAIVRGAYDTLGLRYDTRNGASFYTIYRGPAYANARFDLTAFLARSNGRTVNCTDCASIVSTYANMVGCDLGYNIIRANFPLYFIKAIGTDRFTNDPFNRGAPGGFSYHAITSPIGMTATFDATLNEDGDGTPGAAPHTEVVPERMPRATYLTQLSPSTGITVTYADKTAID